MRTEVVVLVAPGLDHDPRLVERVEDLTVQELAPKLAVEALDVAVLPGRARLDEERLDAYSSQPCPDGFRGELRTIIAPDVRPGPRAFRGNAAPEGIVQPRDLTTRRNTEGRLATDPCKCAGGPWLSVVFEERPRSPVVGARDGADSPAADRGAVPAAASAFLGTR